jgi:hypothetical protein
MRSEDDQAQRERLLEAERAFYEQRELELERELNKDRELLESRNYFRTEAAHYRRLAGAYRAVADKAWSDKDQYRAYLRGQRRTIQRLRAERKELQNRIRQACAYLGVCTAELELLKRKG